MTEPTTPTRKSTRLAAAWPIVAIVVLSLNLRPIAVSVGPVLTPLSEELGLSGTVAGLLTALPALCFAVFGAAAPLIGRKLGLHWAIAASLAVLLAGGVARSLAGETWGFLLFSTIALAGMAVGNVLVPSLVKLHYPRRIGLATASYSFSLAIGSTLAGIATVPLAHALGGWRAGLAAWMVVGAAALLCWLPLLRKPDRPRETSRSVRYSMRDLARTPLGWAMAVLFGTQSFLAYSVFGWLPTLFQSAGLDEVSAGLMLGITTGIGILPAFFVPALVAGSRNPSWILLTFIGCLIVALIGLLLWPARLPWLWAGLLGIGMSLFPMVLALFGTRSATPAATAALSGFSQSVGYLLATLGPLVFGALYSLTGGWSAALLVQLALLIPCTIAGLYACRPQLIDDQLAKHAG